MVSKKERSRRIIPRDYGLVQSNVSGVPVFMTPAAFAIGESIRLKKGVLDKELQAWQEYKWKQREASKAGKSYIPVFAVEGKYEELPSLRLKTLRDERLLEGILKEEGTRNLWRVGGEKAIEQGYLGSRILTGRVKTRSDGRESERMRTWQTVLNMNPSEARDISDYSDAVCQCQDHMWGRAKGVAKICVHLASIMDELADDKGLIACEEDPKKLAWLPFNFMTDTGLPYGLSDDDIEEIQTLTYLDHEEAPARSHLRMDILISHYFMKRGYFDMNKAATKIPNIFHGRFIKGVRSGELRYGVIRQKRGSKAADEEYWNAVEEMWKRMYIKLKESRFERKDVTYSLEFRDTPYEAVCEDWERDDITLRPLFHDDVPPLVIERRKIPNSEARPFATDYNARNPFAQLNEVQKRIDDATRKKSHYVIRIPREIEIPGILRPLYRSLLDKYYHGNREALKKEYKI